MGSGGLLNTVLQSYTGLNLRFSQVACETISLRVQITICAFRHLLQNGIYLVIFLHMPGF